MDKFSELKAAAMAATPGPWSYNGNCKFGIWWPAENCYVLSANTHEDAAFIAAANPAVILALLAELETERASREQWQRNCQRTEERAERLDSMLTESVQALKVAEQLNADAEVRGVEKLAAAFKSWASDETFPDCEAQRHWATASQEALSFAGVLRNGSCDDR
ncbi:ead/Ea22-like family protein [Serratia marcescens]|nr:ead/Ea22-like family protein [Serratia marcescens]MBH2910376.1 ead/Ea22-like family protein [Serratia marcescens]